MRTPKLSFEDWYAANEDRISIELAETGADREMCFDLEAEFQIRYEQYLAMPDRKPAIGIIGMAAAINPFIFGVQGSIASGVQPMAIAHRAHKNDPVITINGDTYRRISWRDDRITADFMYEVEHIMKKRSKLSRKRREYVMHIFNLSFKLESNE